MWRILYSSLHPNWSKTREIVSKALGKLKEHSVTILSVTPKYAKLMERWFHPLRLVF